MNIEYENDKFNGKYERLKMHFLFKIATKLDEFCRNFEV